MKLLSQIVFALVVLVTLIGGVMFALQNQEPVALDLLFYRFAPHSLALWVLSAFALGGLFGMLASGAVILRLRASRAASNRQLRKATIELDRLRTAGLADSE